MDGYDKMRLLACYLATHPGRLDLAKRMQWQKVRGGRRVGEEGGEGEQGGTGGGRWERGRKGGEGKGRRRESFVLLGKERGRTGADGRDGRVRRLVASGPAGPPQV